MVPLNHLHAGASKFSVVMPPSEGDKLERQLLEHYKGERPPCSHFVRHMSVWVPVEGLERWAITYVSVEQQPGQLLITAPGLTSRAKTPAGTSLMQSTTATAPAPRASTATVTASSLAASLPLSYGQRLLLESRSGARPEYRAAHRSFIGGLAGLLLRVILAT